MATNQYGQKYSRNDDFRGYLAGNSNVRYTVTPYKNVSFTYGDLLKFVGNDGGVDAANAARYGYNAGQISNAVKSIYNQWRNGRTPQQTPASSAYTTRGSTTTKTTSGRSSRSSGSASSSSSSSEARQRQNMINYYNGIIAQKNGAIDNLTGSLQNKLDEIAGNYNTYRNEQQSAYNKAKSDYDNSSKQNMQALVTNRNSITDNAARGLRGLMRVLGGMGAGGGSAARYNAPDAVKRQADQENSNAGLTYSQNQQNLDTNWGNYKNDYENDRKKLEDWRVGQEKNARQDIEKQRISLLEGLQEAYGNRATYGEGLGNSINDITNRINAANQTIRDLGRYSAPAYNGMTAAYQAPDLSTYDTGASNLTTSANNNDGGGSTLLTTLRSLNKKKQSSPYTLGMEG